MMPPSGDHMLPLDRKLAVLFKRLVKGIPEGPKRVEAGRQYQELRSRIVDADLRSVLDELYDSCGTPASQRPSADAGGVSCTFRVLRDKEFLESLTLLFSLWRDAVGRFALEQVLSLAPNAMALEAWRKAASVTAGTLEVQLLEDPARTYPTAGLEWLLTKTKPARLVPLLDRLLAREPRPKHLSAWGEVLSSAILKDKQGRLGAAILDQALQAVDRLGAFADLVRLDTVLLRQITEILPGLLGRKEGCSSCVRLISLLFEPTWTTQGSQRGTMTALLARLGTGILLQGRCTPDAEGALAAVRRLSEGFRTTSREEAVREVTWVLENLAAPATQAGGDLLVSLEGARHLAVAFDKASEGIPAKDLLQSLARNLGLMPIGEPGRAIPFDPLQHEDVEGGLVPGDVAQVTRCGWYYGDLVVRRALVKPNGGEGHV